MLHFDFIDLFIWSTNFDEVFLFFPLIACAFHVISEKPLPNPRSSWFILRSSPKSFIVYVITCMSLIHFELIFTCVVRLGVQIHWFMCEHLVFSRLFAEKSILSTIFFKIVLIILGHFHLHLNISISLSISAKKKIWDLYKVMLNLKISLGSIAIITVLCLPIYKYELSLHFFNFFNNVL